MKVSFTAGGKFHIFNLAQQMHKRNSLERLITSYPKFEVIKSGIPKEKIRSVLRKEILQRGWAKLPNFLNGIYNPQYLINDTFDKKASALLGGKEDIVVGLSSMFLHTLRTAKKNGSITIVERGSSHAEYQDQILKEEYENFGIKPVLAHPKITKKELLEYSEADYIAVPSLFVKRTFLEKGIPEEKLIHNPYGVDISKFRQVPKEDNVFRVIFGGGLSLRKGTHYLLRAFSELKIPNSELLLIGAINPEIVPFLEKYAGNYRHLPYQPLGELHKFYSQGSVFVMPSIEEGLALVQSQAMACGLPVICTTNTGGEDIVRDGTDGFVIPIRSVEKIKEKILYLHDNPGIRAEMGRSAKERVSSGFTWDDYGDRAFSAYEQILKNKNNV
jgi:glycosyltransferase involved in cell wall biosynthesis